MITKFNESGCEWIDLLNPTKDEVGSLITKYGLSPHVTEELLTPTPRPRIQIYPDHIYVILHFPAFKHNHSDEEYNQEVDFVIGQNYVITSRYDSIDPLHRFCKIFEVDSALKTNGNHLNGSDLFFAMLRELYIGLCDELAYIEDWTLEAEKKIFAGFEKETVFTLAKISRNLLDFRKALKTHNEIIKTLINKKHIALDKDFPEKIKFIYREYKRLVAMVQSSKDHIESLRATNDSLLNTKQNEIVLALTITAALTLPLSLVAAIFGMNAEFMPIIGYQNDFWIVMAIMLAAVIALFSYFKYKKWV